MENIKKRPESVGEYWTARLVEHITKTGKNIDDLNFLRVVNEGFPAHEQFKMSTVSRWINDPTATADAKNTRLLFMRWGEDPELLRILGFRLNPKIEQLLKTFNEIPEYAKDNALFVLGELKDKASEEDPEDAKLRAGGPAFGDSPR